MTKSINELIKEGAYGMCAVEFAPEEEKVGETLEETRDRLLRNMLKKTESEGIPFEFYEIARDAVLDFYNVRKRARDGS